MSSSPIHSLLLSLRRWAGRSAAVVALWLALAAAQTVRADEAQHVTAVVVSTSDCCPESAYEAAEARLVRELEILDVDVQLVHGRARREGAQRREFLRLGRHNRAELTVRLVRARHLAGVQLWVSEAGSADVTSRYLSVGDLEGEGAAQIASLKAVEAIVGCRQDLRLDQYAEAVPEVSRVARNPRFRVGLGPVLVGSPGGVGPRGGLRLGLSWTVVPSLSIRATGLVTFPGPELSSGVASSTFDLGIVRGWWVWHFVDRGPVRGAASLGGGVAMFASEGASSVHVTRRDTTTTGVIGAGLEAAVVPAEFLRVRFGVAVGVLVPEVVVQFDSDPVASFGRPLVEGSVGIVLALP